MTAENKTYESTIDFIRFNRDKAIFYGLDLGALAKYDDDTAAQCANGCGPSSTGINNIFKRVVVKSITAIIPNHLIDGADLTPACVIHDCDFQDGQTMDDFNAANHRFISNLRIIIDKTAPHLMRDFDRVVIAGYGEAVEHFGWSAFQNKDIIHHG